MPKDDHFHIRVESEFKERVEKFAKDSGYENVTDFILDTIKNRLDPEKVTEYDKKRFVATARDPEVQRDLQLK
jgi:predicted urease superfamily metal-dependent hydrolase